MPSPFPAREAVRLRRQISGVNILNREFDRQFSVAVHVNPADVSAAASMIIPVLLLYLNGWIDVEIEFERQFPSWTHGAVNPTAHPQPSLRVSALAVQRAERSRRGEVRIRIEGLRRNFQR